MSQLIYPARMSTMTLDEKYRSGSIRSVDISTANVAKRLIHSFKLAKRKSRRKSRVTSHGAIAPSGPFLYLSGDIILEIMKNLSVTDVLSLSMVRAILCLSTLHSLLTATFTRRRVHFMISRVLPHSGSLRPVCTFCGLARSSFRHLLQILQYGHSQLFLHPNSTVP